MNDCKFTGRFTAAPRRKDTDKTSRCFFTLMVNKEGKRPDGTKYPAQAVDFVAWGKTAETICQYKDKGHLVLISAEYSTYEIEPIDMNNQPLANARKVQKPIFNVRTIEFMPVNNGGNTQNQYNNNTNPIDSGDLNIADMPEFGTVGTTNNASIPDNSLPFGNDGEEDPFDLQTL